MTLVPLVKWLVVASAIAWVVPALFVAEYARGRGYPFFPLLVCGVFLPFGWVIVLLVTTFAFGPRGRRCPECNQFLLTGETYCHRCGHSFLQ